VSNLYENEDIRLFNPDTGRVEMPERYEGSREDVALRGDAVAQLLKSPGWKILKEYLDSESAAYSNSLITSKEWGQTCRLQAGVKICKSIESFLNSVIWEASMTMDNPEEDPNQGED